MRITKVFEGKLIGVKLAADWVEALFNARFSLLGWLLVFFEEF